MTHVNFDSQAPTAGDEPNTAVGVGYHIGALIGGAAAGSAVALLGTLVHRQWYPWLLIAALLVTLIGGLWLVLWRRALAGVGYLSAWSITALMLAGQGPGGDILLPSESLGAAPGSAGVVWLNLGMVCALLPLLVLVPFGRKRRNRRIPSGAPRQDRENPHYS